MAIDKKKAAETVYNTIIRHLDDAGLKYKTMPGKGDDYMINFTMKGKDLPMEFFIVVDVDREIIMIKSPDFTTFPAEKIGDAAKAVCAINYAIADGSYALDINDGHLMWTMTTSFAGSLIGEEAIRYLLAISIITVDKFNDMFMMLNMGILDIDTFLAKI